MNIRFFTILLSFALFGLVGLQFYWLKMALDTQKERFRQQVHSGLSEVARKLDEREVEYDIFQLAENQEETATPNNLCVNEDSLQKPNKNQDFAYTSANNYNNIGTEYITKQVSKRDNVQENIQKAQAQADLWRAEQIRNDIIAKKNALTASLFLKKFKRNFKTQISEPLFRQSYIGYQPKMHDNKTEKAYLSEKTYLPTTIYNHNLNINFPSQHNFYEDEGKCIDNNVKIYNQQQNLDDNLAEIDRNLAKIEENALMIDGKVVNIKNFEKHWEKWGEELGKNMETFGKDMEAFGKQMEKLDFEMVNIDKIIKTHKGKVVISLDNLHENQDGQRFNLKKKQRGQNRNHFNFSYANNNYKKERKNTKEQRKYLHDTIRNVIKNAESFSIVIHTNKQNDITKNKQNEQDEEVEDEQEQQTPLLMQTVLPKEMALNIPPVSPLILPTNHKKVVQIQEKDEIIKHVLANIEETKKTPSQKLETRQILEARLKYEVLDSFIRAEMKLRGINIPCDFVVERRSTNDIQKLRNPKNKNNKQIHLANQQYRVKGDSVHKIFFENNYENPQKIINAGFSTPIFVLRNTGNQYYLHVDFPQKNFFVLSNMLEVFLSSLALIALVIYCFVQAIRTILKQKKMSEMTTDFINNMTHELKTPIATVALACEALQDKDMMEKLPHQRDRYLNMIQEENQRLQTQVEKVLHIAKLDKGEFALQYEHVDLNEILPEITAQMFLQVECRGGNIDIDLQANNSVLYSDKTHLSHIILNLLDNANKYSPDKPNILVKTEDTETGVKISVIDKGQGMTKEQQAKVFNKFYRVSTGNIHNVKGFGLGLSYVKTMTEALNGKVQVKSELSKGSVFSVEFEK